MNRSHGGPDALGVPRWDFSTNANACGPCPQALAAVRQADAARYPDPAYTALRERLGLRHGVAPWRVVLAASASEFIARITAWVARQGAGRFWQPAQAYGDYARAARAWGLAPVAEPARAQLLWACDPSSPQGAAQPGLDVLATNQGVVVLDRAYEPLRLQGALRLAPPALDRLWQLWSPNKALGLTGVRAAYAIAPRGAEAAVRELDALAASWPLGAHGVALLEAWCEPAVQDWLAGSLQTLRSWKARQLALCTALGWDCLPGDANFFCARPAVHDVADALARLRGRGIKLRDAASFGLAGQVRLATLPPAAQDALAEAWPQIQEVRV